MFIIFVFLLEKFIGLLLVKFIDLDLICSLGSSFCILWQENMLGSQVQGWMVLKCSCVVLQPTLYHLRYFPFIP